MLNGSNVSQQFSAQLLDKLENIEDKFLLFWWSEQQTKSLFSNHKSRNLKPEQ